jgi:ribosomal protein S18 acetylase RimI-like enzyme
VRIVRLGPGSESQILRAAALFDHPPSAAAAGAYVRHRRNVFLLALEGERAVGFARGTVLIQLETERPQLFLYEVAVAARYRRRGVGSSLVERMKRIARQRGCDEMFVFTDDPRNTAAHRLYQATGGRTETRGDRMYVYPIGPKARGS